MKQLFTFSAALLLGVTLLASQCNDAINNLLPDVNTDVSQEFDVDGKDKEAFGEILIDPNTSSDFRDNKSKLKYVAVSAVNFNVVDGTISADRKIILAEVSYKHPDSTTYHSLGSVSNLRLSQMVNQVSLPSAGSELTKLGDLALTSTKGIKLKYRFASDEAGIKFRGRLDLSSPSS